MMIICCFLFVYVEVSLIHLILGVLFDCECSQIQSLKHLATLKLLEITILGEVAFSCKLQFNITFVLFSSALLNII